MRHPAQLLSTPLFLAWAITVSLLNTQAHAQEYSGKSSGKVDFGQLLSSKKYPPTLKLKSLNSQWRRFTLNDNDGETNSFNVAIRMATSMRLLERLGVGVYYTRGESLTMAQETYLLAYRIDNDLTQKDMQTAFQELYNGQNQVQTGPIKFLPDTKLALSLLNLRTIGSLNDLTKFDPALEIMSAGDITEASTDNLRRLGQVLQQFGRYQNLPLRDVQTMRRAFENQMHSRSERLFVHPQTREPYRPNTRLAGKRSTQISNRARVVAIYEAKPGTDNKRGVVFLDGHVERVPEANWPGVLQEQPRGLTPHQIHALSGQNLRRLAQLLMRVAQSQGTFPNTKDHRALRRALMNWGGYQPDLYTHPQTRQPYRSNPALAGKRFGNITNRSRVIAFYEAHAGSDGKIGTSFLDGHIERVSPERLKRLIATAPIMGAAPKGRILRRATSY